jgi:diacylglycerol kinase (ATP)
MTGMKFWIERLSHPFRGFQYALRHDFAIQFEVVVLGVIVLPASYFLFGPFSGAEMLLLLFCWFFIIVAELQNSALETALSKIHPEYSEEIGRSKDLASAAVVWAAIFGIVSFVFVVAGVI